MGVNGSAPGVARLQLVDGVPGVGTGETAYSTVVSSPVSRVLSVTFRSADGKPVGRARQVEYGCDRS